MKSNAARQPPRKKHYRFTRKDCKRGYQAALAKCMEDWGLYAWFWRRIRKHYSRKE
jgi:hypothetical protein